MARNYRKYWEQRLEQKQDQTGLQAPSWALAFFLRMQTTTPTMTPMSTTPPTTKLMMRPVLVQETSPHQSQVKLGSPFEAPQMMFKQASRDAPSVLEHVLSVWPAIVKDIPQLLPLHELSQVKSITIGQTSPVDEQEGNDPSMGKAKLEMGPPSRIQQLVPNPGGQAPHFQVTLDPKAMATSRHKTIVFIRYIYQQDQFICQIYFVVCCKIINIHLLGFKIATSLQKIIPLQKRTKEYHLSSGPCSADRFTLLIRESLLWEDLLPYSQLPILPQPLKDQSCQYLSPSPLSIGPEKDISLAFRFFLLQQINPTIPAPTTRMIPATTPMISPMLQESEGQLRSPHQLQDSLVLFLQLLQQRSRSCVMIWPLESYQQTEKLMPFVLMEIPQSMHAELQLKVNIVGNVKFDSSHDEYLLSMDS